MTSTNTYHASAVEIGKTGILIQGKSGSGKSCLALGLIERAQIHHLEAALVADDQTCLTASDDTLIASAPDLLKGKVEIRGFGIASSAYHDETSVHLVVKLVPDEQVERMPEQGIITLEGISVSYLEVPERHETQAIRIIFAWLKENHSLQLS